MIDEVRIRNFKSLRDVKVGLERFTVFVGPNASGKSSFLQSLNAISRNFCLGVQHGHPDAELIHLQSRGSNDTVDIAAKHDRRWYRYYRSINAQHASVPRTVSTGLNLSDWKTWQPLLPKDHLSLSVLLRLEASKLVPASVNNQGVPTAMAPDGTGMHFALANMALNEPDVWQELQSDFRSIITTIRRIRHSKVAHGQVAPLLFDTLGADALNSNQVSEGTLLVLGLLTALYAPDRPNLILLDDIDRGLHPKAQRELIALLRKLLERNPNLQIIATTHSPYMLDCMEPNEVRMTCLDQDRSTICDSIVNHPKFEKWKDEMAPGELWSLFGEKWLLDKKVAA